MTFAATIGIANGYAMALAGQYEDGIALMKSALQESRAMRLGQDETMRRTPTSEGYLLAGRVREARDTALGTLKFAQQYGHHASCAWVHRLMGDVARLDPSLVARAPLPARPCAKPMSLPETAPTMTSPSRRRL